jgi:hypothetical protein
VGRKLHELKCMLERLLCVSEFICFGGIVGTPVLEMNGRAIHFPCGAIESRILIEENGNGVIDGSKFSIQTCY